ncbi:MAG: ABC transporter ATP-binding protein [Tissierellia bacterium]|nr:ABC transporter ATP-binding protein [Tissierellia bacterium]
MENFIKVRNLYKYYKMGDTIIKALDGVNMDLNRGDIVCIIGTSGSGKSTLLNALAGLEKPSKGDIEIGGINITKLNESKVTKFRQLNVGFVFQSYNLIPTLSALENVSLGLTFKGVSKSKRNEYSKKILYKVGLKERIKHKPSELSGGQQQRVSIARAFVDSPKIIFADEPTGNLDTNTTIEIMELMTSLAKENNQTLIIVTHDIEITKYANKILYMRDGKIEKIEIKEIV